MTLKKWQRIFVNRTLNLGSIQSIGFDLDNTLALYRREVFEALAFRATLEKFIAAGYPEELLLLKFNPTSVIRGLLVDKERGNILKVDGHKYVKIAFHGKNMLDRETRRKLYNSESFKAGDFISLDAFFALSEVQLFSEIIDYMDRNPGKIKKTYKEVYQDLRFFIDESHRDGTIKSQVTKHPEIFINRDKYLSMALTRMIDGGKKLFLITNSDWTYTEFLMKYILNDLHPDLPNWLDYFEYLIVSAGKPSFFTGNQPFYEVVTESNLLKVHNGKLCKNKVYHGGNATLFQQLTGYKGDEILYVGDHMFGDIINSKGLFNWRTMLIVEELDAELPKLEELKDGYEQILKLTQEREEFDETIQILRSKLNANQKQLDIAVQKADAKKAQHLKTEVEKTSEKLAERTGALNDIETKIKDMIQKREEALHPVWGELMKVGLEKSRFAQQVEQYSCIYTSRVSNLRFYSPFKRFVSMHDLMPHEV